MPETRSSSKRTQHPVPPAPVAKRSRRTSPQPPQQRKSDKPGKGEQQGGEGAPQPTRRRGRGRGTSEAQEQPEAGPSAQPHAADQAPAPAQEVPAAAPANPPMANRGGGDDEVRAMTATHTSNTTGVAVAAPDPLHALVLAGPKGLLVCEQVGRAFFAPRLRGHACMHACTRHALAWRIITDDSWHGLCMQRSARPFEEAGRGL